MNELRVAAGRVEERWETETKRRTQEEEMEGAVCNNETFNLVNYK